MSPQEIPEEHTLADTYLVTLGQKPATSDMLAGARMALGGMWFLVRHPELWRYTILSMIVTIFVFLSLASVGIGAVTSWLPTVWARPEGLMAVLWFTAFSLLIVVVLLVTLGFTTLLNGLVAGFYLDQLAERVEELVCGPSGRDPIPSTVLGDILGGIKASGLKLAIWMVGIVALGSLNVVPGLGSLVGAAGGLAWTSLFLALEFTDPPLSRRGWTSSEKWSFARIEWRLLVGFGGGAGALLSIPFVNLFVAPAALVGGTLCFLALERSGRIGTQDRRKVAVASPGSAMLEDSPELGSDGGALHQSHDSVA